MDFTLLEGLGLQGAPLLGLPFLVKLILLTVLVGYLVYSFLLALRIRILDETIQTKNNSLVRMIGYVHLFFALIGSFFAIILILLG